jgi:hypothetical protein
VLTNLSALGIEHLIAIGGDDTLSYAAKLHPAPHPAKIRPNTTHSTDLLATSERLLCELT